MLPPVHWLPVIVSAAAGFAIIMIFYFLPLMQKVRSGQTVTNTSRNGSGSGSENLLSAILKRLWNTLLYAYAFAWILSLTSISPLLMGGILVLVGMLRAAFTPDGWNRDMIGQPRTVRLVDNARFILMYVVMTGVLIFWK